MAAEIGLPSARAYKGKGIRYVGEYIARKEGKNSKPTSGLRLPRTKYAYSLQQTD